MATVLVIAVAAAGAAGVAWRLLETVTAHPALRARNYRGLELPLGSGIAVVGGTLAGWGILDLLADLADIPEPAAALPGFALLALGFAFLGLFDDLSGSGADRGWRAHLQALRRARATAGAFKMVGGIALAVIAAPAPDGLGWGLARAALIALSANLVNLFDLRPGRAGKIFILAALTLAPLSFLVAGPLIVAVAAVAICLRADLRERIMLGDAGANALGAIAGAAAAIHASHVALVAALVVLAGLHAMADRPGLSAIIDAVPPLRAADRAGRVRID